MAAHLGWSKSRFDVVIKEFDDIYGTTSQVGAALAIYQAGQPLVNVAAGFLPNGEPWTPQTKTTVFSISKALSTVVVALLHQQGVLNVSERVAHYWPEFAQVSERLSIAELLQHKAGLSAPRVDMDLETVLDHRKQVELLIRQKPLWEPGSNYSYHALTFGTLVQELVLRATGQSIGATFEQLVATPLGIETCFGKLRENESPPAPLVVTKGYQPEPAYNTAAYWDRRALTMGNAFPIGELGISGKSFGNPRVIETELPGVNARSSANDLAKLFSSLVSETEGKRLLNDSTREVFTRPAIDSAPFFDTGNGWVRRATGFMLSTPKYREFLSDSSFGHDGLGGQVAFSDSRHKLSFALVTNNLMLGAGEHENWQRVVGTLREALASN